MLFCLREDIVSFTNHQLVIAVSSRALFDLEHENRIFETDGIAAYRTYQEAHREEPLAPGVAFLSSADYSKSTSGFTTPNRSASWF